MNETEKILLRRKHLLIVKPKDGQYQQTENEKALVVSALKNVQSLGFTFSQALLESLFHFTKDELKGFYASLIPALKELAGADVEYRPMYPNFPTQVAEADDVELFINAIIHYWAYGTLLPEYEKTERLPLIDNDKMVVLSVGNRKDYMQIFENLVASKTSLSDQDKEDVKTIMVNCPDYVDYLPNEIPLKENVAFIGKLIFEEAPIKSSKPIQKYFKTATDVLRLVTALSNGDISLAGKTKYRSLKRRERRMILDLLVGCGDILEDLYRYKYEWIRIAEIIHVGEYHTPKCRVAKYNDVVDAFNVLRNEHKPLMFGGKVQNAILAKDMLKAANLLKARPGEFARQLDKVIRDSTCPYQIVNCFKEVAADVSAPVLLQVRQHFIGRMAEDKPSIRVFFPKGNLAKATSVRNVLPPIDEEVCRQIAKICRDALIEKYKNKESLGNVYVDADLKNYLVPFSQRSASKAAKTIVRGSQVPISESAKAIRGFIWWTNSDKSNGRGYDDKRVDIDLSAAIYDENWRFVEHVSYTNLRSSKYRAYHSGDIVNGGEVSGKGVAEFLDVDIDAVAKNAGRYIVYQVYSFTKQKFNELPNCRFGWMEREDVDSGEIFEPKTVEMKMDLIADGTVAIPVIFDCVERKFIWCDMNLGLENYWYGGNNLESNLKSVTATCYAMTHLNKPNLYDLAVINAKARGNLVTDRNQADVIFSNDLTVPYEIVTGTDPVSGLGKRTIKDKPEIPIITAFDTDYIIGQLL